MITNIKTYIRMAINKLLSIFKTKNTPTPIVHTQIFKKPRSHKRK
jgi:hypothetical protein